jgi:hypothetical protein
MYFNNPSIQIILHVSFGQSYTYRQIKPHPNFSWPKQLPDTSGNTKHTIYDNMAVLMHVRQPSLLKILQNKKY